MTPRPTNVAVVIALQPIREERKPVAADGGTPDVVFAPAAADVLATLLARVAMGDRSAFRALFELARGRVFGICLRMLRNRAEAEEALQDVFVRLWQHGSHSSSSVRLVTTGRHFAQPIVFMSPAKITSPSGTTERALSTARANPSRERRLSSSARCWLPLLR
jgi:hypothetical protein